MSISSTQGSAFAVPNQQRVTLLKIVLFVVLVQSLAWSALFLGGSPESPGLGLLVWGLAPIASGLLLRFFTNDWADVGVKPKFSVNKGWYLLSFLIYPVVVPILVGLSVALGFNSLESFSWLAFLQAFFASSSIYFVFSIFEEFGWRSFLAPKLALLKLNKLVGHLVLGVVWASWHLPFISTFASYTNEGVAGFIPRYFFGIMAFAIVYGEIKLRTNTVWPAVILHWLGNMITTPLMSFMSFTSGGAYLFSFGASGLIMTLLFAVFGIYLYWQREHKELL